jgi:predicted secreted protein
MDMTADGRTIQRFLVMTLVAVLLTLTSLFTAIADLHAQEPPEVTMSAFDDGHLFQLTEGQELVIELDGNPSTGYTWEVTRADGRILRQIGETEFQPQSQLLGAPGKQVLRFEAIGAGQTDLELVYHRPWETHIAPLNTFSVQVEGVGRFVGLRRSMYDIETEASGPSPTSFTELSSLPPGFSWAPTYTTPIKDQGLCGSCWAFACVGMLESNIKIKDGFTKDLSEQYLLSCNPYNFSCSGGNFHAHDMHEYYIPPGDTDAGAVYEGEFGYVASKVACGAPYANYETIFSWDYVSYAMPTVTQIKQAIMDHGPIGCGIRSGYSAFWNYTGGVFETHNSGDPDHAVVLVGWDDNQGTSGVWILRNSWGTSWGDNGYMYIGYGVSSVGTAANYINYLPHSFPNTVSLPLVARRYNRYPSPTWSNIMTEYFEGTFPGPGWALVDNNGPVYGEHWWGRDDHKPYQGMYSAWPARSGANGVDPATMNYPDGVESWMIYGPFSLVGAMDAELLFRYWLRTDIGPPPEDLLAWTASIDGNNFYGPGFSGNSNGWQSGNFDLTNVFTVGDLRGQSQVWIAFLFKSNLDGKTDDGAYIDNIQLRRQMLASVPGGGMREGESITELPGTLIQRNLSISIED